MVAFGSPLLVAFLSLADPASVLVLLGHPCPPLCFPTSRSYQLVFLALLSSVSVKILVPYSSLDGKPRSHGVSGPVSAVSGNKIGPT